MKTKLKITVTLICLIMAVTLLVSCSFFKEGNELTLEGIFGMAKDAGYEGTVDDFVAEFKGEDGRGLESVSLNDENHLIVVLSDGASIDCGVITLNGGTDGKDGSVVTVGADGNWYIDGVDTGVSARAEKGEKGDTGPKGEDGKDGAVWLNGSGVPSERLGSDGDMYLDTLECDIYNKVEGVWVRVADFSNAALGYAGGITSDAVADALFSSVMIQGSFDDRVSESSGSGVIYRLDKAAGDAYIITNYHVVYRPTGGIIYPYIYASLFGYEKSLIECEYIGGSFAEDIAVIKISASDKIKGNDYIKAAELASSASVNVSDEVIVSGNAQGMGISATHGRVSVNIESMTMKGADNVSGITLQCLRIDAPVNHGNSGGGLYNKDGKLVGIINAKMDNTSTGSVDNIGFAIPIDIARAVADNIIETCSPSAASLLRLRIGVLLSVVPDGASYDPATGRIERADKISVYYVRSAPEGLEPALDRDDIITGIKVGDKEYSITRYYQLVAAIYDIRVGDTVEIHFTRGGVSNFVSFTAPSTQFAANYDNAVNYDGKLCNVI